MLWMRLAHQSHLSPWFLINHIPMIPRFLADLFFHFLTILELSCLVVLAWLGTNLFVLVHSVAQKQYHLPFLAGGRGGGAGGCVGRRYWFAFVLYRKHCQWHNGPEGWVLVTKVTSLGHITSSQKILIIFHLHNLDQAATSTKYQHFDST